MASPRGDGEACKGGTVLVVEDDRDVRQALKDVLEQEGFAVLLASNGADAINLLAEVELPCAILLDLRMPGIVGQELLEFLESDDGLASIPVAVVSGSPELAPPGRRVFGKPLDLGRLVSFVTESCRVRRAATSSSA